MRHDGRHELLLADLAVAVRVHLPEGVLAQRLPVHVPRLAQQVVDVLHHLLHLLHRHLAVAVGVETGIKA